MKVHPVAELFPMMPDAELRELAESIKREGQINPCVQHDGVLLDGRNRLRACEMTGVRPRFIEYTGESPVAFIIAANLARRNLDKGQKIALALEIEPHFAEEARKRQEASRAQAGSQVPGRWDGKAVENVPQPKPPSLPAAPTLPRLAQSPAPRLPAPPPEPAPRPSSPAPKSRDQAASAVGVSGKLVSQAKAIKQADPERFEKVKAGTLTVAKATREIRAEQEKRDLLAAQQTVDAERRERLDAVCDLRVCSCAELFRSGIKPDAVITDPPYPAEFLPVFTELAEGCALAGVPLVAVMSGQSYLPEVMRRLSEHLRYRWTLAYLTPGGQAVQQWQAKVNTSWKPVLLFGEAEAWFGDVATSRVNDNDKRFHGWGQSESGMADLVERLTKPGQLVCDPFLGGGTTAVVALALGRRFVGCDIDAAHVEQARARVAA